MSSSQQLFDAAGRRRSPATMPGHHARKAPRNKGQRYPADPPTVDEIVAVMREASEDRHGRRLRALIVVLWRAGLRIQEALALTETDLDERRGSVLIRHGKNDKRREVGWTCGRGQRSRRRSLTGPICRSGRCSALSTDLPAGAHGQPAGLGSSCGGSHAMPGVRRFAPHQLRHAHAVELLHEGIPLPLIQRQLGHSYLSTTGTYLQGIDSEEIISAVHGRRAPMMHASAGLKL